LDLNVAKFSSSLQRCHLGIIGVNPFSGRSEKEIKTTIELSNDCQIWVSVLLKLGGILNSVSCQQMMRRRNFVGYSLLFLAGCTTAGKFGSSPSGIARPKKLRFAVTDARGLEELQRDYEPFRSVLEEILETKVEFFPVENVIAAAPAMLEGVLDLAWAGPSEYVVLHSRARAKPIATLKRSDYRTVIIVHKKGGFQSIADLKGKTIDIWKLGTTASHLGAVKILLDAGLQPSDFNLVTSDEHNLKRLETGEIDAMARPLSRYKSTLQEAGKSTEEYPLLAEGPFLPGDVFAVSHQMKPEVSQSIGARMLENRERLLEAIIASKELADRFRGSTLEVANDTDYDLVREVYRAIGQEEIIQ
jgi:phosphonate transport system substrate-binding protein